MNWVSTSVDDNEDRGGELLKQDFSKFLERLLNVVNESHDQEELNIIAHGWYCFLEMAIYKID